MEHKVTVLISRRECYTKAAMAKLGTNINLILETHGLLALTTECV